MSETRARNTANVATELVDIAIDVVNLDAEKLDVAGGKILQIVRATDGTNRTTTSTAFVDASLSVTITPQKSDSAILLIATQRLAPANNAFLFLQITDNSNNAISGASAAGVGGDGTGNANFMATLLGYATPATTSATTYKLRFSVSSGTGTINNSTTGQLYAIEVSA